MTSMEDPKQKRYPGETDEAYPEKYDIRAMPAQPVFLKPGQQPEEKIRQFFEQGYTIFEDFFTKDELDACQQDVEKVVEDLAQTLFKAGKIKNLYTDAGLFQRLTLIEKEFPDSNMLIHKPRTKHNLYQGFRDLWANERLLNLVEQLLGPDIMGNPVWNVRPKIPQNENVVVPWHQDSAYTANELYDTLVVTAWIPLINATKENGCLQVMSGGHKTGRVAKHTCCAGGTWYVDLTEEEMQRTLGVDPQKDKVLCEIPYGGMILFNNMLPHRGLPNVSSNVRWSLDLRWMKPSDKCGWYGKQGIVMRSKDKPIKEIDWDGFLEQNRKDSEAEEQAGKDMFETIFTSPYFKRWEITNYNRHIKKFFEEEARQQTATSSS